MSTPKNKNLRRDDADFVERDTNEDPISGEHGAHPVGVGIGAAAAGAATGALGGAAAGPVGAAVGAVVGAVAGGLGGKAIAESIDPTVEVAHWRSEYSNRPYYSPDRPFEDYEPAYRFGMERHGNYPDRTFDEVEADLARDWEETKAAANLRWADAKDAARDAWCRLDQSCGSCHTPRE